MRQYRPRIKPFPEEKPKVEDLSLEDLSPKVLRGLEQLAKEQLANSGTLYSARSGQEYELRGDCKKMVECTDHESIIVGPRDTGKTMACCIKAHLLANRYKGCQGAIIRKTQASMAGTVLQTFSRIIEGTPVSVYGGQLPQWYDYPNGSRIWVGGMDNPDKVLSSERDFIYVCQAEELIKAEWEFLAGSASGRAGNIPHPQIFGDCNPAGSRHWIKKNGDDGTLTLFKALHKDNPTLYTVDGTLTLEGKTRLDVLAKYTGMRRKRLFEGLWVSAEGVVYDMFDSAQGGAHVKIRDPREMTVFYLAMDEGYCYSDDTEVLTKDGWKNHKEDLCNDRIACFDTSTGRIYWAKASGCSHQNYRGKMVHLKSRSVDILVTPEHSMWVSLVKPAKGLPNVGYKKIKAKELVGLSGKFRIKTAAPMVRSYRKASFTPPFYYCERKDRAEKVSPISTVDWSRFLGWFVSEGSASMDKHHCVCIGQNEDRYVEEIDAAMAKLPYAVYKRKYLTQWGKWHYVWRIYCKELVLWLREHCGHLSQYRKVPEMVMCGSVADKEAFLESLLQGDGSRLNSQRSPVLYSSSNRLLDQVQQIAVELGYSSTKSFYKSGMGKVSLMKSDEHMLSASNVKIEDYNAPIHCLTTPTGFYVTRRNGKIAIQGNTNPQVNLLIGSDSDKRWHIFKEFYVTQHLESEVVAQAKEWFTDVRKAGLKIDDKANHRCRLVAVDNAAAGLIAALKHAGLYVRGGKGRIIDGIYKIQDRLKVQKDGKARLTVDPGCVETINEFESYTWKPEKDVPIDENNHSMACLRYLNDVLEEPSGALSSTEGITVGKSNLRAPHFIPRRYVPNRRL